MMWWKVPFVRPKRVFQPAPPAGNGNCTHAPREFCGVGVHDGMVTTCVPAPWRLNGFKVGSSSPVPAVTEKVPVSETMMVCVLSPVDQM